MVGLRSLEGRRQAPCIVCKAGVGFCDSSYVCLAFAVSGYEALAAWVRVAMARLTLADSRLM